MNDCDRFKPIIQDYVAGELDEGSLGPVLEHCRTCEDCRGLMELHRDLTILGAWAAVPDEAELDALRDRVLRHVSRPAPWRLGDFAGWHTWTGVALRSAAAVAAVVLLFGAGLLARRALPGQAPADRPTAESANGTAHRLLTAITTDAASNRSLGDVEDSRFTYSNVWFRRLDDERVALDFDVTTHVQLVEPLQSQLVREVLVHALLDSTSTGARLKAMSFAAGPMDRKVKEALIFTLHRDDSLAVRIKALTVLVDHLEDGEIENAVLTTLREDESVQMRLLALDYLAAHRIDRDVIRETIRENQQPGNEALLVRLAEYES
jgi:hypothetical protein